MTFDPTEKSGVGAWYILAREQRVKAGSQYDAGPRVAMRCDALRYVATRYAIVNIARTMNRDAPYRDA